MWQRLTNNQCKYLGLNQQYADESILFDKDSVEFYFNSDTLMPEEEVNAMSFLYDSDLHKAKKALVNRIYEDDI